MGVSGTGKTTVARSLAQHFGLECVEGDDLHSAGSVAKMRDGIALTDEDRWPWLDRITGALANTTASHAGIVVSCSALRRAYRDHLRQGCPGLVFVFLDGSADCIAERMSQRKDHYMPLTLLHSQLRTLERPGADEADVLRIDIDAETDEVIAAAAQALRQR